jgi:hypothetical protein
MRFVALVAVTAAACGSHGPHDPGGASDASHADTGSAHDDAGTIDGTAMVDAPRDAQALPDAFPAVLDVRIDCHNTCVLTANPAAINVMAGTSFQVNWINVGDTECDVSKVDQFNHVPIIIGLEPGMSYHDAVRDWCGTQFTGTFNFEIDICTIPSYIPVNCGA